MPKGVYPRRPETIERLRASMMGKNKTHGMGRTPTYRSWEAMKRRCLNPNAGHYIYHGGRGITICDRWLTFLNFLADMGERPLGKTLDRIDNDGNYEPGNCRWATMAEQSRNRRRRGTVKKADVSMQPRKNGKWIKEGLG